MRVGVGVNNILVLFVEAMLALQLGTGTPIVAGLFSFVQIVINRRSLVKENKHLLNYWVTKLKMFQKR